MSANNPRINVDLGNGDESAPSLPVARAGSIGDADMIAACSLVASATRQAAAGQESLSARRALLDGLAELIGADNWLWVLGRVGSTREDWRVVPLKLIKCGRVSMVRGAWHALRMLGAFGRPAETIGLHDLALAGAPFVRTIAQVLPPDAWEHDRACLTYRRRLSVDDLLYVVRPSRGDTGTIRISSVMFGRATGRAPFGPRERAIAGAVFFGSPWMHELADVAGEPTRDQPAHRPAGAAVSLMEAARLANLPEKEQQLVPLLASDLGYAEIGGIMGLTESTIKTYAVRVFRELGVKNRNALRDRFALVDLRSGNGSA